MVNKVILIGNLGRDPELKEFQNGGAICNLSVATSKSYKNKSDEWVQDTQWHRVSVKGQGASRAAKFRKGDKIYIEGELQYRSYTDDSGVDRHITEISAYQAKMVENRNKGDYYNPETTHSQTSDPGASYPADGLPF